MAPMPSLVVLSLLAVSALVTSFISGILGMAGGMILMGILLAMMPLPQAMMLHGITQLSANGWRAWLWRHEPDSAATEPAGLTVLCAELPADPGDAHWALSDEDLGARVAGWLDQVGLPIRSRIRRTVTLMPPPWREMSA